MSREVPLTRSWPTSGRSDRKCDQNTAPKISAPGEEQHNAHRARRDVCVAFLATAQRSRSPPGPAGSRACGFWLRAMGVAGSRPQVLTRVKHLRPGRERQAVRVSRRYFKPDSVVVVIVGMVRWRRRCRRLCRAARTGRNRLDRRRGRAVDPHIGHAVVRQFAAIGLDVDVARSHRADARIDRDAAEIQIACAEDVDLQADRQRRRRSSHCPSRRCRRAPDR